MADFYIPPAKTRIYLQLVLQLVLLQSQLFTQSISYTHWDPGLMPALQRLTLLPQWWLRSRSTCESLQLTVTDGCHGVLQV